MDYTLVNHEMYKKLFTKPIPNDGNVAALNYSNKFKLKLSHYSYIMYKY